MSYQHYISSAPHSPTKQYENSTLYARTPATQMSSSISSSTSRSPLTKSRVAIYENTKPKSSYEYETGYLRRPLTTLSQPAYHLASSSEIEPIDVKELAEANKEYKTIAENKAKVYSETYYFKKGARSNTDYKPYYAYYTPQNFSFPEMNKEGNNIHDNLSAKEPEKWSVDGIRTRYQTYSCLRHTKVYRTYYTPRVTGMDYHEHQFGLGKPWTHYVSPVAYNLYNYKPLYLSDRTRPVKGHVEVIAKSKELEDLDKIWRVAKGDEIGNWDRTSGYDTAWRSKRELPIDRKNKLYNERETEGKRQRFVSRFGTP